MWSILVATAWAKAPTNLTPGEEYGYWSGWTGNAYTIPKGMFVLHPWLRSGIGLTDRWDLKASIIGEVLGPQLATEVVVVQNEDIAASIEARGAAGWGFHALDYGFVPHFSAQLGKGTQLDLSFAIQAQAGTSQFSTSQGVVPLQQPGLKALRPELGLEFAANDSLWLVLTARTNLRGWHDSGPNGALGVFLNYGKGPLGFDFGLNIAVLGLEGLGRDLDNITNLLHIDPLKLPPAVPLPLPVTNLWFRF